MRRKFNGVHWARFLAHAAVNAAQLVNVELLWIFLAVIPRTFIGHNVNAIRGARRGAHKARNASHAAIFIFIQPMHAAEIGTELSAFLNRAIVALLLWILHHPNIFLGGTVAAKVFKRMAHGGAESLEHRHNKKILGAVEFALSHINNLVVWNCHGGVSVIGVEV